MAVEIPVYVDIQGAFDRAVKEIPKEMPKLEKVISQYALNMKIDFGGGDFKTVRNLLTDTTMSSKELETALVRVRKAFNEAVAKDAGKSKTSATVNNLAKAYGLLEQRAKGFYNSNAVAAMRLEDTIAKITFKINDLRAKMTGFAPGTDQFNKLNYELSIQQKRLTEVTKQQALYKAGVDASNTSIIKQSSLVRQLTGYFSGLYAAHTVLRFAKQVRDVTGELEYQRVALGHLLDDVNFGNELFAKTIEAAKESPFRIGQLVTYTKQLAAYRIEQEELFDTTQRLADISAGLGVSMDRLILAYGQVRAASVLRGQELRQFTEAGIPLVEELAEKFTKLKGEMVTTADVFKLISERAVPFEYIKEIFEELTEAGGMFYKMQEEQAKTLKGRWDKLKDAYDQALMSLGEDETFQHWNDVVLNVLNAIAKNLKGVVRLLNAASVGWLTYKVATSNAAKATVAFVRANTKATASMIKMFGVTGTLQAGIVALKQAWKQFTVALSANWVGLVLSAIATAITWFTTFKNKAKETTEELRELEEAIADMKQANEDAKYTRALVSAYKELAEKTSRTDAENRRFATTLSELKGLFPELADKIDAANVPLEKQVELLNEEIESRHALAVADARVKLDAQKQIIRGLEDEVAAAKAVYDAEARNLKIAERREEFAGKNTSAKQMEVLKNASIEAGNAARKASDAYEAAAKNLAEARRDAEELEEAIDPKKRTKDMQQWAVEVLELQKAILKKRPGDTAMVFTEEDLNNFTSVYDLSGKLKKKIEDLTASIQGMRSEYEAMAPEKKAGQAGRALEKEIGDAERLYEMAEAIRVTLGLVFSGNKESYTQDPFIQQMQERMKFMKDFKKGYDDLRNYMSKTGAMDREAETMLTRGLSLGVSAADQKRAAEDLSSWYDDAIRDAFKKAQRYGAGSDLTAFLSREITGSGNKEKALRDFQNLIQSLFDAKTDIDTAAATKNFEEAFKRITDELKRSETARNFYRNILDATGDEELATSMTVSVYGGIGADFTERMQQQLNAAMAAIDPSEVTDDLREAINKQDYSVILQNLEKFPKEWQQLLKDMASSSEKYNADWVEDIVKTYEKTKTYQERITDIQKQEAQKRKEITESDTLTPEVKAQYILASQNKEAREIAKVQLEARKDTYTWTKAFENLESVSDTTLRNLISLIDDYIKLYGRDLEPQQLKELVRQKELAEGQLNARHAYQASADALQRLVRAHRLSIKMQKNGLDATEAYEKAQDDERNAITDLEQAFESITTQMGATIDATKTLLSAFMKDEVAGYFGEQLDRLHTTMDGIEQAGIGIARLFANPLDPSAWVQTFSGLANVVSSIFGIFTASKMRRIDKDIEVQRGIVENLAKEYSKLEKAIANAFGSDYIHNYSKQLENLQAQMKAYQEQARLEEEKGRKADEEKIKEYQEAAESIEEQIADMEGQLAEFFTSTDVRSAAEDFAKAWIEAYKSFGSTTSAMKEKFQEMIESMITQSLAAKMMQTILDPLFREIDEMAKTGGELSAEEIATIAKATPEYVDRINAAMNSLMTELLASGYNVRQQAGGLTGIARSYATASEESINGLAAGVNTSLFYLSYVPTISADVAMIRAAIVGGAASPMSVTQNAAQTAAEAASFGDEIFRGQMQRIDENIAEMKRMLGSVITLKSANTNTHVVAVK